MDRCALFVDAGYLLADGAMAVHGTRNRDSVSWDYAGLARLLDEVARDRTGLPLLRCYWYEATSDGRRTQEQDGIADIPGIKFRAARIRPGRREGVESYVQRDLTTLARTGVLCEAVLVSGDEDMAQVVSDVQDLGVRVTVVHISVEGNWTISRTLRRECDDLIEIGAGHLRPYVNLLAGTSDAEITQPAVPAAPLSNGQGRSGVEVNRQPVTAHTGASRVEPAATASNGLDVMAANTGGQQPMGGSAMEQLRAMQQSLAQHRGGDHLAPQDHATPNAQMGGGTASIDANGFPSGGRPGHQQQGTGEHPGMGANPPTGANPAFTNPATGAHPSMRGPAHEGYGAPNNRSAQQPPAPPPHHQAGTHHNPMVNGPPQYEQPPAQNPPPPPPDPRYGPTTGENPGFGGNSGPNPTIGASTAAESGSAPGTHEVSGTVSGPRPEYRVHHGPHTNPTPVVAHIPPGSSIARSIEDAVHVARKEGNDFAESIARDAPVLWLEAVLARSPRLPSDLEARLLQGSALPIDYLLRDEVRQSLRQGFWDALERART